MLDTFLRRALWFLLLLLLQVLLFNHVHILGYATPMVLVYFPLLFPSNALRSSVLLWSFALGLVADTFSNTPGVASFSLTFIALLQPGLLSMFSNREERKEAVVPSTRTMGAGSFMRYVICGATVYVVSFFLLESFSFFNWLDLILNICGSSVLTVLVIMAFESIRANSNGNRKH